MSAQHLAKTRRKPRPPRPPVPLVVQEWMPWLRRRWKVSFHPGKPPRNVSQDTFHVIAERVALIGTPRDENAQRVFIALATLCFSRRRLDWTRGESLAKHVQAIPTTPAALLLLTSAVEIAERELGPLSKQSFPVPVFIEVVAALGSSAEVERHVRECLAQPGRRSRTVGAIFHPNSREFTKDKPRDLRQTRIPFAHERGLSGVSPASYNSPESNAEYMKAAIEHMKTRTVKVRYGESTDYAAVIAEIEHKSRRGAESGTERRGDE